jgi:hypothetical protein
VDNLQLPSRCVGGSFWIACGISNPPSPSHQSSDRPALSKISAAQFSARERWHLENLFLEPSMPPIHRRRSLVSLQSHSQCLLCRPPIVRFMVISSGFVSSLPASSLHHASGNMSSFNLHSSRYPQHQSTILRQPAKPAIYPMGLAGNTYCRSDKRITSPHDDLCLS